MQNKTQTQIDREKVLAAKEAAHTANGTNPALTAPERTELEDLRTV